MYRHIKVLLFKHYNSSETFAVNYKLSILRFRSALQIVHRDRLATFIEAERHEFLSAEELMDKGYKDSVWNKFKHEKIKDSLKEAGKLRYLNKSHCEPVLDRPLGDE